MSYVSSIKMSAPPLSPFFMGRGALSVSAHD
jgi:hypothetical protein